MSRSGDDDAGVDNRRGEADFMDAYEQSVKRWISSMISAQEEISRSVFSGTSVSKNEATPNNTGAQIPPLRDTAQ